MAQVSRNPLAKDIHDRVIEIFLTSFTRLNSKRKAKKLLFDLLTPTERIMLAKRLAIAYLLEKKFDHRSIAKLIKVSHGTIQRVNLIRNFAGEGFQNVIHSLIKEDQIKQYFQSLENSLNQLLARNSQDWSSHKRHILQQEKTKPF